MALFAEHAHKERMIFRLRRALIENQCVPLLAADAIRKKDKLPWNIKDLCQFFEDYPECFKDLIINKAPNRGVFVNIMAACERDTILRAIDECDWNNSLAAQVLGINRTTLVEKMKKNGIRCIEKTIVPTALSA